MPKSIILQPGLVQVRTQHTPDADTGDVYENIIWFQSTTHTKPSVANFQAMAAAFDPAWGPLFANYGASTKQYTGSIWTDFGDPFGVEYSSVGTFSPASGTMGNPVPPNTAILVWYSNGEHYKGGHFRTYLPWVGTGAITGAAADSVLPTVASIVASNVNVVVVAMNSSGVLGGQGWRLYRHRFDAVNARLDPITTYGVRSRLATQRRRLRKAPHK